MLLETPESTEPFDWTQAGVALADALLAQYAHTASDPVLASAKDIAEAAWAASERHGLSYLSSTAATTLISALQATGTRHGNFEELERAKNLVRSRLAAISRETSVVEWSNLQMKLGDVCRAMYALRPHPAHLNEALTAFRAAIAASPELDANLAAKQRGLDEALREQQRLVGRQV